MAFVGSLGTNQTEEASGGVFVEPESSLDWNVVVAQPSPETAPLPFAALTARVKVTVPEPDEGAVHSSDQLR